MKLDFTATKHLKRAARRVARATALPLALAAGPLTAQNSVSRPVVQPLPPEAISDLDSALRRLARNTRDFSALVDAGKAALELDDVAAAIGFFGRADEVRPGTPQVKAGLAAAYLRSDRPLEALRLFAEAERAGPLSPDFLADRGLAYDLVGDNAAAQAQYRAALARGNDAEVVRRLALSQAIAGDKAGFEATLLPQLRQRSFAAYRARSFGLAILGEESEAVTIAQAVMPPELADRVAPYLRYMPRLTPAQQAAAANLGVFPRAAQIGRDDPRIAQYAGGSSSAAVRAPGARLTPAGRPLGPRKPVENSRSQRRRPDRASSSTERSRNARETQAVQIARADPQPAPPPPPEPQPSTTIASVELPPTAAEASVEAAPAPGPGFDLAQVAASRAQPGPAIVLPEPEDPPPVRLPPPTTEPDSVAEAFADFELAAADPAPAARGAVDITAIEIRREAKPPPKPAKPVNPSRHWVQVATGKDLNALAFDWRRFAKKASRLLGKRDAFTTPWGESRRLLTGPFESDGAAQDMVNDLKAAGLDAFTFTSEEGQAIAPLGE